MGTDMDIGLNNFRQASGGFLQRKLKLDQDNGAVCQDNTPLFASRLIDRVSTTLWGQKLPAQQRALDRIQVKQEFLRLLRRTEGDAGAERALRVCGFDKEWERSGCPLTNRQVSRTLNKAQEFRQVKVRDNDRMLSAVLTQLPGTENRDLRAAISRAVKTDPRYGNQKLEEDDLRTLCKQAEADLLVLRQQQCQERFPKLSRIVLDAPDDSPLRQVALDPATLINDMLNASQGMGVLSPESSRAFSHMEQAGSLLGLQAWNIDALKALSAKLEQQLRDLEAAGIALQTSDQSSRSRKQLHDALRTDTGRQIELLKAKIIYVDEMRLIDPLTDRSVKHSNMVWAHAGQSLLGQLGEMVGQGHVRLDDQQRAGLAKVRHEWADVCSLYIQHYHDSSKNLDALQTIPAPRKDNRDAHPIVQGKRDTLQELKNLLERANIPKSALDTLFSKGSLARAERTALSGIHTWQPLKRDMPVMRDGALRIYRSEVMPAHLFDQRLGLEMAGARSGGVSPGFKDIEYHARNLKVSRLLDQSGRVMTTVVGHGVLDMRGIQDEILRRQANRRGAMEVLELALSSNSRLMGRLAESNHAQDRQPPRLVHVSVNLISPDSVREKLPGLSAIRKKPILSISSRPLRTTPVRAGRCVCWARIVRMAQAPPRWTWMPSLFPSASTPLRREPRSISCSAPGPMCTSTICAI